MTITCPVAEPLRTGAAVITGNGVTAGGSAPMATDMPEMTMSGSRPYATAGAARGVITLKEGLTVLLGGAAIFMAQYML
jgi:hypothetical protein